MSAYELKCADCDAQWVWTGIPHALFDQQCPSCASTNYKQAHEFTRIRPGIPAVIRDSFTKRNGRSFTLAFDPTDISGIAQESPTLAQAIDPRTGDVTFESRTQRDRAHREMAAVKQQCEDQKGIEAEEARSQEMRDLVGTPFDKALKAAVEPQQPITVG